MLSDKSQNKLLGVVLLALFLSILFDYREKADTVEASESVCRHMQSDTFENLGCLFLTVKYRGYNVVVKHHPTCKNPDHR
jgi:hypothetical protein